MSNQTFATAINCMDGRVQLPVIEWMKEHYSVQYVDMITEAGPNKVLLEGDETKMQEFKTKVSISTEKHGSEIVAVVGHHDCAGNPIPKEEKWEKIEQSVQKLNTWDLKAKVIGLYVNENWEVEVVQK